MKIKIHLFILISFAILNTLNYKRIKKICLNNNYLAMKKANEIKKRENKTKITLPVKISNKKADFISNLWFNDIDDAAILDSIENTHCSANGLIKPKSFKGVTQVVAIDCEFVGTGWEGKSNMLARVSIVNENGHTLLDTYVKPVEAVVDYRTNVSGILPEHLKSKSAIDFKLACEKVAMLIKDSILVGHGISNDLKVLYLNHPRKMIRDTSKYKPFVREANGRTPGLRMLSNKLLGINIQNGEHDSVIDARATMRLYQHVKHQWEKSLMPRAEGDVNNEPKLTGKEKHALVIKKKRAIAERLKKRKTE